MSVFEYIALDEKGTSVKALLTRRALPQHDRNCGKKTFIPSKSIRRQTKKKPHYPEL